MLGMTDYERIIKARAELLREMEAKRNQIIGLDMAIEIVKKLEGEDNGAE